MIVNNLKEMELNVLIEFDKICKENNLRYSLAYGTLLGAIRHKGFIPWDDDIDVMMPRADYEKLLALRYNSSEYKIFDFKNDIDYCYPFAKMCYKKASLYETYRPEKNLGPYIDIFPMDYLPLDNKKALKVANSNRKRIKKVYRLTCSNHCIYKKKDTRFLKKLYLFFQSFFISNKTRKKYLYKFESKVLFEPKSEKILNLVFSDENINALVDIKEFNDLIDVPFEGHSLCSIKDYDRYLTGIYGDYMKMPPEENRVSNHGFIVETKEEVEKSK